MHEKHLYLLAQFDSESQRRLADCYEALSRHGFVGTQTKGIPYHFTLGRRDPDCESELSAQLERVCAETRAFDIHMSHIGLFGLNVLFVAHDVNAELLSMLSAFFPECGSGAYNRTMHATLLIDEPDVVVHALPVLTQSFRPFIARVESVVLYEFFPARLVRECRLQGV